MRKVLPPQVQKQIATPLRRTNLLTLNIHDITVEDPSYDGLDETFGAGAFRLSTNGRDLRLKPTFVAQDGTECDTAVEAEEHDAQEVTAAKTGSFVINLIFGGISALTSATASTTSTAKAYGATEAAHLIPQSKDTQQIIVTGAKFAKQTPQQQLEFMANADSFSCRAPVQQSTSILGNDAIIHSFSAYSLMPEFVDNAKITKVSFQQAAIGPILNSPKLAPALGLSPLLADPVTSGASFMDRAAPQPRLH